MSNRIRSLQLGMSWLPEQPGNGLDRVYFALVRHLPHAGVSVKGLVAGSDKVREDSNGAVQAFASDRDSLVQRVRGIRRDVRQLIGEHPIDIIASHFALYTAPVVAKLRDKPMVVHFHGPWAEEGRVEGDSILITRLKKLLERRVYRRADRFIVLSQAFKNLLHEQFGVPLDQIRIVPGGVDVERFQSNVPKQEARKRLGWPSDRRIILCVRRLARRMGLEDLIEAVGTVVKSVPGVHLYIAGKGPIESELRERIEKLGLALHVTLLGYVSEENLPLAYRAADLSVVPTVALEGFGLITIESLASGTPVLVTPVGGLPETVVGLSKDLILPGSGAGPLAEGLRAALDGRIELPCAATCERYARENFDWAVAAARVRDVYSEVLA